MKTVKAVKIHPCPQEGCKASFPRPSKLAHHLLTHNGEKAFMCTVEGCTKGYTTKSHLKRHCDIQHAGVATTVRCEVPGCERTFSTAANLKRHARRFHDADRRFAYACGDCQQSFAKKRQLHEHSYLHTGVHYYTCEVCGVGFASARERSKHQRAQHEVEHTCDTCGERFTSWQVLRRHRATAHRRVHKCRTCEYKTYKLVQLRAHAAVHRSAEQRVKYACTVAGCTRAYFYRRNLSMHVRQFHEGVVRRVGCTMQGCDAQYSRKLYVKNHIQHMHSGIPRMISFKPRQRRRTAGIPKPLNILGEVPFSIPQESSA